MFNILKEDGYTKVVVEGKLKHSDYIDTLIPKLDELSKLGSIKIMMVMTDFAGIELKAILDDIKTVLKHRKTFNKVAIVTNKSWIKISISIFRCIITGHVNTFTNEQDAQQWLNKI